MGDPGKSEARSIRSALVRLGMHATRRQIVAELARLGTEVSPDQVERARIDLLKDTAQVRGAAVGVPRSDQRRVLDGKVPRRSR